MTLAKDVSELNNRFDALLSEARRNEATLKKFQSFELALMAAGSLEELIKILIYQNRSIFDWDLVALTLVDPQYEISRLFEQSEINLADYPDLKFIRDRYPLINVYNKSLLPMLTSYSEDTHSFLFTSTAESPASIGLLPLIRNHQLIGSFNIGSFKIGRFRKGVATDFLQHLAAVIAVCIDISLSKEGLKHLGLIDNLTGVNNRRFFDQRLLEETARVKRTNAPVSCLFIDVDYFKKINDNYGHQTGDDVLRYVAKIIREQVRSIDIVARYGGEEFTVILLQTGSGKAEEIADRIRLEIASGPFQATDGKEVNLTVSIGISTLLPEQCGKNLDKTAEQFIEYADKALYVAKNDGRNRIINYKDV